MKTARGAVLFVGAMLFASPALAQYYPTQPGPPPPPPQSYPPPPPPPQYYPPPQAYPPAPPGYPPPGYYPPPPPVYYRPQPVDDGKIHYTIRASGGVAFASSGYYCGYYSTFFITTYSCGAGYVAVFPDVNLDLDVWFRPNLGMTFGANVMWGTYTPNITGIPNNAISSTIWEPHIDVLSSFPSSPSVKGRVRFGFGIYIADTNGANNLGQNVTYNSVGGAFRLGFGASLLANSKVGIGIDAIFEAGWIGSSYVSTVQLLIGPELHF
jgi:hypothetical protein